MPAEEAKEREKEKEEKRKDINPYLKSSIKYAEFDILLSRDETLVNPHLVSTASLFGRLNSF